MQNSKEDLCAATPDQKAPAAETEPEKDVCAQTDEAGPKTVSHRHTGGEKHVCCAGNRDEDSESEEGCCGEDGEEAEEERKNVILFLLLSLALLAAGKLTSGWISVALFAASYLCIGHGILKETFEHVCHGRIFDENLLMTVASLGAFLLGDYIEAIAVVMLYEIGELLQDRAVAKSKKNITDMLNIRPDHANRIDEDGQPQSVAPEDVPKGSLILIRPGERVPLDCVLVKGTSSLDVSALTGESMPREVSEGDTILSGSINLQSVLTARTTEAFADSTVQRILRLTQESARKKSSTERFITRFARVYTPIVFGLAVLLACVPPLAGLGSWGDWLYRGLVFLVVSCPCALVISVPVGLLAGMGGAAKNGIIMKGGHVLDRLCGADTIIFDKTGTLTQGHFSVQRITAQNGDETELLRCAALCEAESTHPIARSVMAYCTGRVETPARRTYKELSGMGVAAESDGFGLVLAGNRRLMEEYGIALPAGTDENVPGTLLYLAQDGRFLGTVLISDTVKPGAAEALRQMREAGIRRTALLTGDRRASAEALSRELGLDTWRAELLPQDKVAAFEKLCTTSGAHLFVGDGINDAPLLARADVGVAMGGIGSDAAVEAADCVLMKDDLAAIPLALRQAKRTKRIVYQNIVFALSAKGIVLLLAALGWAPMWLAIFADVGVALLCVLNSTRAIRVQKQK